MLISLFVWLCRKYLIPYFNKNRKLLHKGRRAAAAIHLLIILLISATSLSAQDKTLNYTVRYKKNVIGSMQFQQRLVKDCLVLKVKSDVQMRFLMQVNVYTEEEAHLYRNHLVYSRIYRKVNGKEKVNRARHAAAVIPATVNTENDDHRRLPEYNLLYIFLHEPEQVKKVYSNYYQCLVPIEKVAPHRYKLKLPDGNCNYYSYKDGVCSLIKIEQSLYTVTITLEY